MSDLGRLLIGLGVLLIAVGSLLTLAGKLPWLGRLPGDFFYKNERVTVYFPLATSLLVSLLLSLLLYLWRK